ncbi:hypothetical protein E1301_Tti011230 [Triplophysa tibetana]|uniref:Uncharacterized protein n=1 Tax=Triplophysa tibetana TaxID=1572043 RepID=A0A5A9MY81_9TELE|nr:hypothetical protein E1301_Tti011230 [Triplophysa tibetana]
MTGPLLVRSPNNPARLWQRCHRIAGVSHGLRSNLRQQGPSLRPDKLSSSSGSVLLFQAWLKIQELPLTDLAACARQLFAPILSSLASQKRREGASLCPKHGRERVSAREVKQRSRRAGDLPHALFLQGTLTPGVQTLSVCGAEVLSLLSASCLVLLNEWILSDSGKPWDLGSEVQGQRSCVYGGYFYCSMASGALEPKRQGTRSRCTSGRQYVIPCNGRLSNVVPTRSPPRSSCRDAPCIRPRPGSEIVFAVRRLDYNVVTAVSHGTNPVPC